MNISCTQCQQLFSISASQLGTRGKCPHCHAHVTLPMSAQAASRYNDNELPKPKNASRILVCLAITFLFHLLVLWTIAFVPWHGFSSPNADEADWISIGRLPTRLQLETKPETFEPVIAFSSETEDSFSALEAELFSSNRQGQLESNSIQDWASSAGDAPAPEFLYQPFSESEIDSRETEEFSDLVSKLNRDGLDVIITFDSSGSMQGEIDQVKNQINRLGSVLFELIENTRIGICTYRDIGDNYLVDGLPLTDNLAEAVLFLEKINASGGGNEPEAVDAGLEWATRQGFRPAARKVILLFGDAPPRPSKSVLCERIASEFGKKGGIVSTVTCRKTRMLDDFVRIAQSGRGEAFLTTNEHQIMAQLIVLVFGSQHRGKVIEAFDLLNNK